VSRWGYQGARTKETGNPFPPLRVLPFGKPVVRFGWVEGLGLFAVMLLVLNIIAGTI